MKDKLKNIFNKKTVYYIESITYILSIIVVVVANVFGPICIRMIPLLFLLGVIGKLVFNRPVITTLFGGIVSLCVVRISGVTNLLENMLYSGIFMLYIALGEIFGSKIKVVYKYWANKKNKKDKEYILSIIICIVIALMCTLFHNYTDSNIFLYNSCKNKLYKYLNENYPNEKFDIMFVKYNFESENNFTFDIQNETTGDSHKFIVYLSKELEIYDGIKEGKISIEQNKATQVLNEITKDVCLDIKKSITKVSEGYELNLVKTVDKTTDDEILKFSQDSAKIIDMVLESEKLNDMFYINLSLINNTNKTESKISTIYLSGYLKNKEEGIQKDYNYIMKSLNIEYID